MARRRCPMLSFIFILVLFGGWFYTLTVANHVPKMLWIRSVGETLHDTLTRAALSVLLGNNGKVVNQTAGETAAS